MARGLGITPARESHLHHHICSVSNKPQASNRGRQRNETSPINPQLQLARLIRDPHNHDNPANVVLAPVSCSAARTTNRTGTVPAGHSGNTLFPPRPGPFAQP